LRATVFDFLQEFGSINRVREIVTENANGTNMEKQGVLDSLTLGEWTHTNVIVNRKNSGGSVIGLPYLSRFQMTLDVPEEQVFLKPGKMFDEPSRRDCLGIGVRSVEGKATICHLDSAGPAAKSGLKDGDILESVNGDPVDGTQVMRLRHLFTNDGETVRLTIRRGDRSESLQIRLRDY
jgi:predicted metalloprotease with PDZ domain